MGQHIICRNQVGLLAGLGQLLGQRHAKEALDNYDALGPRSLGGARSRLDPIAGDAGSLHILQQIAIIGSDLDHTAGCPQAQTRDQRLHITLRVGQPGRGKRAEVGVVLGKQSLTPGIVFRLHQPAGFTDQQTQRKVRLRPVQARLGQIGIGRRRTAQVQERQAQGAATMTTLQSATPSNPASSIGCAASRADSSVIANGQVIPKRSSCG
ncbi:hypothetical protein D3C78_1244570 [compost metagenome]